MADWNVWRNEADRFDIEYELSRYDESEVKTYRETIKELKKIIAFANFMKIGAYWYTRQLLIPKENARQRAQVDGICSASKDAITIFKEADKFTNDPYQTLEILANKIKLRRKDLEVAKKNYNERKKKSIYEEMFVTIEICWLITAWRIFLNQDDGFIEK